MGFGSLEAPMIRLLVAMLLLAGLGACAPPAELYVDGSRACDRRTGPRPRAVLSRRDHRRARQHRHRHEHCPGRRRSAAAEFQEALVRTLTLANLAAAQNGRFRLEATLLRLERPYAGFAMTVTAVGRLSADRDRNRRRRLPGHAHVAWAPPA